MPEKNKQLEENDSVPFYPDHFNTELWVAIGITILVVAIGVVGVLSPVGLGDPADPMNTPAHVKPEWYFLALYQLLKYIPKTIGAIIPVLAVLVLALWPFLDRKPDKSRIAQKIRLAGIIIFMVIFIALTIWGEMS